VVGGVWAERDLTRGWRVSGRFEGSIRGLITSTTGADVAAAEMAARAEAERSDDALGGGRGGACPIEASDDDDDALLSGMADSSSEAKDVVDAAFWSTATQSPSEIKDVEDTTF
jgi:hypothetical protein